MGVNGGGWDGRKLRDEQASLDRMQARAAARRERMLKRRWWQSEINLTDVSHECPHGKLPKDRIQTCLCWVDRDGEFTKSAKALEHRWQESP